MNRKRLTMGVALVVLVLLPVAAYVVVDGVIWETKWSKLTTHGGHGVAGWVEIRRFGSHATRDSCYWYISTGFVHRAFSAESHLQTVWDESGMVERQWDHLRPVMAPPWSRDIGDQTQPTAPWIIESMPFDLWWTQRMSD